MAGLHVSHDFVRHRHLSSATFCGAHELGPPVRGVVLPLDVPKNGEFVDEGANYLLMLTRPPGQLRCPDARQLQVSEDCTVAWLDVVETQIAEAGKEFSLYGKQQSACQRTQIRLGNVGAPCDSRSDPPVPVSLNCLLATVPFPSLALHRARANVWRGHRTSRCRRSVDPSARSQEVAQPRRDHRRTHRIDILAPIGSAIAVAFGDSWMEGTDTTPGADNGFPDQLNRRMERSSVVYQGISGNRLLSDGVGEHALARVERDVLDVPGVTHVLLNFGLNDLVLPGVLDLQFPNTVQFRPTAGELVEDTPSWPAASTPPDSRLSPTPPIRTPVRSTSVTAPRNSVGPAESSMTGCGPRTSSTR